MVIQSELIHLHSPECGKEFEADRMQTSCRGCQSPLVADYHLQDIARNITRAQMVTRPRGLWRCFELLSAHLGVRNLTLASFSGEDIPSNQWALLRRKCRCSMLALIEGNITG
jgi:threonine synthase